MIKIGACNFWELMDNEQNGKEFQNYLIKPLINNNLEFELCDCHEVECDIVFTSCFPKHHRTYIKGNPIIIYFSGEHPANRVNEYIIPYDYSLGFYDDNETNLYYPLWQLDYQNILNHPIHKTDVKDKNKFCTFIVSNGNPTMDGCNRRTEVFDYVCEHYKTIDSYGRWRNNTGQLLADYKTHFEGIQAFHNPYKFNMCFENTPSNGNLSYITEKIIHAYAFGVVPIYWGAENITKWFNKDSFINCNGLNDEEILQKIKEVNENDDLYQNMLNANPFNENINWREYAEKRLYDFIKKICKDE